MSERAFALKESVKDFAGATTTTGPEGKTVDVGARLENNNGVIVTDDPALIVALEGLEVLKDVPVPAKSKSKGSES